MWPIRNIVEGLEKGYPAIPSVAKQFPQVNVQLVQVPSKYKNKKTTTVRKSITNDATNLHSSSAKNAKYIRTTTPNKIHGRIHDLKNKNRQIYTKQYFQMKLQQQQDTYNNNNRRKPKRPSANNIQKTLTNHKNPRERRQQLFQKETTTQERRLKQAMKHLNKRTELMNNIRNGNIQTIIAPSNKKNTRSRNIINTIITTTPSVLDQQIHNNNNNNNNDVEERPEIHTNNYINNIFYDNNNDVQQEIQQQASEEEEDDDAGNYGTAWTTPGSSVVLTPNPSKQNMMKNNNINNISTIYDDGSSRLSTSQQQQEHNSIHNNNNINMITGHTLHDDRLNDEIEKRTYEWGEHVTRVFQRKLVQQTRRFNFKSTSLKRQGNRAKDWIKEQFKRWISELTDEIVELKQSGFVDVRRTTELVNRFRQKIEIETESRYTKETKLAHLQERYKVEMHLQRAKFKTIQNNLNEAIKYETELFDDIFLLQSREDELKKESEKIRKFLKSNQDILNKKNEKLKKLKYKLKQLQEKEDIPLDPKLIHAVQVMSKKWRKVKEATEGIFYDLACPFCITLMRTPKTVDVKQLGGIVTMCSHCLTERLKNNEFPPTTIIMEHRRVQNLVKQFNEKLYLKNVKGIEKEIASTEKLVGIVHSKWKRLKRLKKWGMLKGVGK